jgi:uncharacterized protein DUF433
LRHCRFSPKVALWTTPKSSPLIRGSEAANRASAGCASPSMTCSYLASGMTQEQILRDFPYLTKEDIQACLAFAADRECKVEISRA